MVPELRPRGVGEILDTAVALYRARFWPLLAVTLAVVIPVSVLSGIVMLSAQPDQFSFVPGTAQPDEDDNVALFLAATLVITVLTGLASAFVTAAATRVTADAYVESSEAPGDAVRHVARRTLAVVGLALVSTLGILAGSLCIVPGLLLQVAWCIAVPALILEGGSITQALGRSFALTKQHFGLSFGVFWLSQLLTIALGAGLAVLVGLVVDTGSETSEAISTAVTNGVSMIITTPFVATALVALYFDLRIRSEAFDVQMMLMRLDARQPGTVGAR